MEGNAVNSGSKHTKFIFFMIDKCLLSKWTNSARESEATGQTNCHEIMEEIHTVLIPRGTFSDSHY